MNEDLPPIAIPEWVVTFGDMMSLLLTFFIMLVSMSEIKKEDKYDAVVESIHNQFGYTLSVESVAPGELKKPRVSEHRVLATTGRAKKKDTASGGVPEKAPIGDESKVRTIRPGQTTGIGLMMFFPVDSSELDQTAKDDLDSIAYQLIGKPQKIEIRGHSSAEISARSAGPDMGMTLAYLRAASVMHYLVERHEISVARFRIATAGDSEPVSVGDPGSAMRNSRAELFLLDETVDSLRGDANDRSIPHQTPASTKEN